MLLRPSMRAWKKLLGNWSDSSQKKLRTTQMTLWLGWSESSSVQANSWVVKLFICGHQQAQRLELMLKFCFGHLKTSKKHHAYLSLSVLSLSVFLARCNLLRNHLNWILVSFYSRWQFVPNSSSLLSFCFSQWETWAIQARKKCQLGLQVAWYSLS